MGGSRKTRRPTGHVPTPSVQAQRGQARRLGRLPPRYGRGQGAKRGSSGRSAASAGHGGVPRAILGVSLTLYGGKPFLGLSHVLPCVPCVVFSPMPEVLGHLGVSLTLWGFGGGSLDFDLVRRPHFPVGPTRSQTLCIESTATKLSWLWVKNGITRKWVCPGKRNQGLNPTVFVAVPF